jgi:hypothetical protein
VSNSLLDEVDNGDNEDMAVYTLFVAVRIEPFR